MKGKYIIEKYSAENIDGEWVKKDLIEVIEADNNMTAEYAYKFYTSNVSEPSSTETIICVAEQIYDRPMTAHPNAAAVYGWTRGSLDTAATYFPPAGMDDAYFEFKSTILPPASVDRNIRTLCLSTTDSNDTNECYSIVSLSAECVQTTSEILQITYRLINDITTITSYSDVSARQADERFRTTTFAAGTGIYDSYSAKHYGLSWDRSVWGTGVIESVGYNEFDDDEMLWTESSDSLRGWTRSSNLNARYGSGNSPTNPTEWCGFPLKGYAIGEGAFYHVATIDKGTVSSMQNTFARAADDGTARAPFLDNDYIATSSATVDVQDYGDWVNYQEDSYTMPWLYRLTIETGGDAGTATYKVRRRRIGFPWSNEPRWEGMGISLPTFDYRPPSTSFYTSDSNTNTRHGQSRWVSTTDTDNQRPNWNNRTSGDGGVITQMYNYPEMLCFDYDGLTIHSVSNAYINFDTNSTPALSVTEVLQASADGSTIYVADAATGLHMLQRDIGDYVDSNATITQLSPPGITDATSCRGVHCGYQWQEGSVTNVRVIFGGANYAAADTVTIAGANGTSATAVVQTVDADGAILTVKVTNPGSGYIMENIQAYVSSGSGVGAKIHPEVGSDMEVWALFNDTTDAFMYLGHATKVGSDDYTSGLTFATASDTITRTDGTSFLTDGFRVGQQLFIKHAEDAGNNGVFTINTVTATVLTVDENLTNSTGADTEAQIFAQKWEIMTETITSDQTSLAFDGTGPDTITRTGGTTFPLQGFREGMEIVISSADTGANDGVYTIATVTDTVITIDSEQSLTTDAGPDTNAVLSTLTDFTITNYTSGSPGRVNFIGLMWDREHADGRFAMLTPATKYQNNGIDSNTPATSFDWWSFVNSTGTTTAGTTDRIRSANIAEFSSSSGEHICTQCIAPLNNDNLWVCQSYLSLDARSTTWGTATTPDDSSTGYVSSGRANVFKTKAMDSAITGLSTSTDARVVIRKNSAELASATTWDTALTDTFAERGGNFSGAYETNGAPLGYIGNGVFTSGMNGVPRGQFILTFNGDGKPANEDLLPYGFWEEFGWDGTRWVLGNASARTTHTEAAFVGSNLDIDATAGTIDGTFTGTDWAGDGFEVGDTITIATAEDTGNDGSYVIESLSTTVLTITPYSNTLTDDNATDTAATVVGSRALIDGLSVSFAGTGVDALVVDEFYDAQVYDGILCDNATNASVDVMFYEAGTETGTDDYSSAGAPATTVPAATGTTTELFSSMDHTYASIYYWSEGLGKCSAFSELPSSSLHFGEQNLGTGDFEMRYRISGTSGSNTTRVGLIPWANIVAGGTLANNILDWNIGVDYDFANNPTLDIYEVNIYAAGNTSQTSETFERTLDRVMLDTTQDYLNFDDTGSNGDWEAGSGYVNNELITMDDGSVIEVLTHSGGQILTWQINSQSTATSERTERILTSDATNFTFTTGTNTIQNTNGTNFSVLGFVPGMKIWIRNATDPDNNGNYTITTVATDTITVDSALDSSTDTSATISTAIIQASSDGSGVDFAFTLGTANEVAAALGNDQFAIARVGAGTGNVRFKVNGVEFYRITSAYTLDVGMGCSMYNNVAGFTINDWEADFTKSRRTLQIGNGTTTGRANANFKMATKLAVGTPDWNLYIDGVAVSTINTDGFTAPTAGVPTLLPAQGEIWFHDDDAGKTITGNWRTIYKLNMT